VTGPRRWLVSHGADDGIWQLIGTSDADDSTGRLGHLHHVLAVDARGRVYRRGRLIFSVMSRSSDV